MPRHLITLLILFVAIALYIVGMAIPATILVLLGVLMEGVFWFRLLAPGRGKQ